MNTCKKAADASTRFERLNNDLKRRYFIKNMERINMIMEHTPGYCGSFGTGYPFYVLDDKFQGELPIIEEQIRYNNELYEYAKEKNIKIINAVEICATMYYNGAPSTINHYVYCPVNTNYRSIPEICKFANTIYPEYAAVNYIETEYDGHHGLYWITEEDIEEYISATNAIILRHDKRTAVDSRFKCLNYGESKGRTFNHVIIYPTEGILKWLCKGKALADTTRSKFYVAATRPKYSLAILDKTGKASNKHFHNYKA
mgnify:CR=1 FL=1